ncbi:MAG: MYG1 family protein [Akkermansiaceae bacterium]
MPIHTIITHPGGAHKDDFLACSLMAHVHGVPIERRDPTPENLMDTEVCVIDVGLEHDPEKNNFDHHQFPRDYTPTCALTLVLQHMGLYEDARLFCDWLEPAEWFDTRGPGKTAEWLGIERDVVSKLNSPIDMTMLRRFANAETLVPGEPVYELMKMIGEDLVSYLEGVREKINFVTQHVQRWEVVTEGESFSVLYMPRVEAGTEDVSGGLTRYIFMNKLEHEIVATVLPDSRGDGYGIARFNDYPRLDFTRVENEADVHFAHKSGFLCKTSATEPLRLKELLVGGWK